MRLIVANSNSKGNGYALYNGSEALILEAGVTIKKLLQAIGYNVDHIAGCLITHEHGDHAKYWKQYVAAGIDIYTSAGTIGALNAKHHRMHTVTPSSFKLGGFKVLPFNVIHDVAEPYGYLIHHKDCGNTLFMTDTQYMNARFPGINNIIMETNYCEDIIEQKAIEGVVHPKLVDRIRDSHMSIQTAERFLLAQDLSEVNKIVLTHLSDNNSNAGEFGSRIAEATGKSVSVAESGAVINIDHLPF